MRWWNWNYVIAFLLPLLALISVPSLRVAASKIIQGAYPRVADIETYFPRPISPDPQQVFENSHHTLDDEIWALDHGVFPDRFKRFESSRTEADIYSGNRIGRMFAYAELSKENPNNALLPALALQCVSSFDGRVAGPWEDNWDINEITRDFSRSRGPVMGFVPIQSLPTPEGQYSLLAPSGRLEPQYYSSGVFRVRPTNTMSSEELNLGLQLSQQGRRLAPENSYFDWMAARYLFAARRDPEAVATLVGASQKPVFDDYRDDLWRIGIRCLSRPSPLLAEQKLTLHDWCIPQHNQIFKHATKMALWAAMQRWEAGDEAKALEIEGALVRLHLLRYRQGEPAIDWARPIQDTVLVWQAPFYMRRAQILSATQGQLRQASSAGMIHSYASAFAAHARDNEREDLARESTSSAKRWASLWQLGSGTWGPYFSLLHGKGADARIQLSWFAVQLAGLQGVVALGLWTFFSVFGPLRRPRGADIAHFGPRVVFYPVIIGGVISLLLTVVCQLTICQDWQLLTHSDYVFVLSIITIAAPCVLSTLTCLLATTWAVKSARVPQPTKRPLTFRELLHLSAMAADGHHLLAATELPGV